MQASASFSCDNTLARQLVPKPAHPPPPLCNFSLARIVGSKSFRSARSMRNPRIPASLPHVSLAGSAERSIKVTRTKVMWVVGRSARPKSLSLCQPAIFISVGTLCRSDEAEHASQREDNPRSAGCAPAAPIVGASLFSMKWDEASGGCASSDERGNLRARACLGDSSACCPGPPQGLVTGRARWSVKLADSKAWPYVTALRHGGEALVGEFRTRQQPWERRRGIDLSPVLNVPCDENRRESLSFCARRLAKCVVSRCGKRVRVKKFIET